MKKIIYSFTIIAVAILSGTAAPAQIIRTVAGIHDSSGYTGDGGYATVAEIGQPNGIAVDAAGNIYFSDAYNNVVRKVTVSGIITTIAGIAGSAGYNGDTISAITAQLNNPLGVAVDLLRNVYIADNGNFRVRKVDTAGIITTVAGVGGIYGFGNSGDFGPATSAHLYAVGIAVDQYQNIYIADGNNSVRKVKHSNGYMYPFAGSGAYGYSGNFGPATDAALASPTGVAVDASGDVYIADYGNNVIRMVNTAAIPIISTIAGTGTAGYSGDGGDAHNARLRYPYSVSLFHDTLLYIADMENNRIRKVLNPATTTPIIYTVAGNGSYGYAGDGGSATAAKLGNPSGICVNYEGSLFITDQNIYGPGDNSVIREVSKPTTVTITADHGSDICIGTPVSYTAVVSNFVLGEQYQWKYNSTNVGADTSYYASSSLSNGDKIICTLSFPIASDVLAISDTVTMTVNPLLTPAISIASDTNNICAGLPLTFTATSVNGGTAPVYQWQVNGYAAHIGSSYTYDPANGDVVNCFLTSNAVCATPDTVTSNLIRTEINADVTMALSIITPGASSVMKGQMATFIAQPTNEGLSPHFQWFVNGRAVPGATSNVFNSDSLSGSATVFCVLTGSQLCTLPLTDTSTPIAVNIVDLGIAQSINNSTSLILSPNPNKGSFMVKGSWNTDNGVTAQVAITNVLGQEVYSNTIQVQNGKIDAQISINENLPAGMYLLHIGSGDQISCIAFVVKK